VTPFQWQSVELARDNFNRLVESGSYVLDDAASVVIDEADEPFDVPSLLLSFLSALPALPASLLERGTINVADEGTSIIIFAFFAGDFGRWPPSAGSRRQSMRRCIAITVGHGRYVLL
jgi:hypothetical protein